jgi:hypothetical protein
MGTIFAPSPAAGMTVEPGVYLDMPAAHYHAIPALSNSGMKHLAISPLRYWHEIIAEKPPEDEEESKALRLGTALHCAVLEGDEQFDLRYAQALDPAKWPVCLDTIKEIRDWTEQMGAKAGGTKKDEVIAQALALMKRTGVHVPILAEEERRHFAANEGKIILGLEEWRRVCGMARALKAEPKLAPILASGRSEVSIIARDPETGVLLKVRIDWMAPKWTLDLKTFSQQRGKSIDKSIGDAIYYERYWVQAYFYDYVRRLATGERHEAFETVFGFVESEEPYETRLKSLRPKWAGEVNLYWETARIEVKQRIREYADYQQRFGLEPWREAQDIETLTDGDVRQFAFS